MRKGLTIVLLIQLEKPWRHPLVTDHTLGRLLQSPTRPLALS